MTTLAGGFAALVAVRFCAGLGFGAALPNMMAIAAEISAPEKRASTAAAMFCGMPLGGGTSALVTQLLPPDFDLAHAVRHRRHPAGAAGPRAVSADAGDTGATSTTAGSPSTDVLHALFGEGRALSTLLLWLTFLPTLLILYLILNWLPTLVMANGLDRAAAPQASLAFNFASVAGRVAASAGSSIGSARAGRSRLPMSH